MFIEKNQLPPGFMLTELPENVRVTKTRMAESYLQTHPATSEANKLQRLQEAAGFAGLIEKISKR